MATEMMPDLSHLTEEERKIIEEVLQRQKAEENKEQQVQQQFEQELNEIERQINERKDNAMRLIGTQDDAICQICQKTKFADGIGHKCYYCQLRSCARCGGRVQVKTKSDQAKTPAGAPSKGQPQKTIWACSLCQKRQQILGKTGKWFQGGAGGGGGSSSRATTPTGLSPTGTPTPTTYGPVTGTPSQSQRTTPQGMQPNGAPGSMGPTGAKQQPFTLQQPQPPSQQHQQQQQMQMQQMAAAAGGVGAGGGRGGGAVGANQNLQQGLSSAATIDRQQQQQRSPSPSQLVSAPYHDQQQRHPPQQQLERQISNHQPMPRSRQNSDTRRPSVEADRIERPDRRGSEYQRSVSPGPSSSAQPPPGPPRERRPSTHQPPPAPSPTPFAEEASAPNGSGKRRPSDARDHRYSPGDQVSAPSSTSGDRDRRRRPSRERWPPPSSDQQPRRDSREYYDESIPPTQQTVPSIDRRPRDDRTSSPTPTPSRTDSRSGRTRSRSPPIPQSQSISVGNVTPTSTRHGGFRQAYDEEPTTPPFERPRTPQDFPMVGRNASRDRTATDVDRNRDRDRDRDRDRTRDRDRDRDRSAPTDRSTDRDSDYANRGQRSVDGRGRGGGVVAVGASGDYAYDNGGDRDRSRRATSRHADDYYEQRTPPGQQSAARRGSVGGGDRSSPSYRPQDEYVEERYVEEGRARPPPAPSEKHSRSRDSSRGARRTPSDQHRTTDSHQGQDRRTPPDDDYDHYSHRKVLPVPDDQRMTPAAAPASRRQQPQQQQQQQAERRRLPEPEEVLRAGAAAAASGGQPLVLPQPTAAPRSSRQSPHAGRQRQLETGSGNLRQDSLSSDAEIMHRPGPVVGAGGGANLIRASPTNTHYHHHHHHSKTHYGLGGGQGGPAGKHSHGHRSQRLSHHKQRSFSSSDDEVASTSECPSCEELESETYSDRGSGDHYNKYNPRYAAAAALAMANANAEAVDAQLMAITGRQLSVTWQPSADGQRMIGHMILRRPSGASLGLKVVGGRPTPNGRLGAFVTKVKRGSVAEMVGHLKPGDEVLEWNGRELQNASFDEVCDIINESKHDPQVELIVSRPIGGAATDYGVKGASMKYLSSVARSNTLTRDTRVDVTMTDDSGRWETTLDDVSLQQDNLGSERRSSNSTSLGTDTRTRTRTSIATTTGTTRYGCGESLKAMLACTRRRTLMFCPFCCQADNEPVNDLVNRVDTLSLQKQVVTMQPTSTSTGAFLPGQTPVVMITAPTLGGGGEPQMMMVPAPGGVIRSNNLAQHQARGQIFGRIQIALVYSPADQQLVITVYQAIDLPPRNDGSARNPYVKMFLLPDRSEKSRRQSKTLASTCQPTWQQSFIYQNVTQMDLATRVLETTLWDYDKYATNEFLGEVLFDLASSLLDNEPRWYTLTDMDEESPVRLKLRHLRLSAYANQQVDSCLMAESATPFYGCGPSSYPGASGILQAGTDPLGEELQRRSGTGYRSDARVAFLDQQPSDQQTPTGMSRSRTYYRPRHPEMVNQDELDDMFSGYYSDHGHRSRALRRLPRAAGATGVKGETGSGEQYDLEPGVGGQGEEVGQENLTETELVYDRDGNVIGESRRHLPRVPADIYGEEAMRELGDKAQQMRTQGAATRRHHSARSHRPSITGASGAGGVANRRHQQRLAYDPMSPPNDQNLPGYLSDGSETSMSITSTQSERPTTRTHREFQNNLEAAPEETEPYDGQDGTMSDSAVGGVSTGPSSKSVGFAADAKRKKSIMTRLIPGRAGSALTLAEQQKQRMGFPRSEEVGVPAFMTAAVGGSVRPRPPLQEQGSFESQGSVSSESSLWLPMVPGDGPLGEFIAGLGQGQVVGRQALASPCLGEIQLTISHKSGTLEVKVIRARNLVKKPGAKYNPAPYVKVYLMEGKYCIAKAKTSVAARTAEPRFDQRLVFNETYRGRLLQVSVWGDYGRMERKVFMGIALIRMDLLETTPRLEGMYKLYHSSSLVGTGSPARKESQTSLGVDQSGGAAGGGTSSGGGGGAASGNASYANQNSTSALARST